MQVVVIIGSTNPPIGLGIKGAVDRQRLLYESQSSCVIAAAYFGKAVIVIPAESSATTSVLRNCMSILRFKYEADKCHCTSTSTKNRVIGIFEVNASRHPRRQSSRPFLSLYLPASLCLTSSFARREERAGRRAS
jgi:hypothetical protein